MASRVDDVTEQAEQRRDAVRAWEERELEERDAALGGLIADDRAIMAEVRMIGGAMITILIIALVLTEVYDAVDFEQNNSTGEYEGPFGSVVGDLETTGVAAMSLLVVGLLVVAAVAIMRFFNGGGGFGGR